MRSLNTVRGTYDILPQDVKLWRYIESKAREVMRLYGYQEIRTPIFEHTEVFEKGTGETTDIVEKQMYTFPDRKGRSLTLRPEATPGIVRAYLEHKLYGKGVLHKFYQIGPMFRYERPQGGRQRQFHQIDLEAIGSQNPLVDAEQIVLLFQMLWGFGIGDLEVQLNSIGCPKCRPQYRAALRDFFRDRLPQMCQDCRDRFDRNPLRILDCKVDRESTAGAPKSIDYLCSECQSHFERLQEYLELSDIGYSISPYIVRGLDYYTKTVFEVVSSALGSQDAICGGGRYDGLVEVLGGPPTPAVGWAVGVERLIMVMRSLNVPLPDDGGGVDAFLVVIGDGLFREAYKLQQHLRRDGISVVMDYDGRSVGGQFKAANRSGAKYSVVLGEAEWSRGAVVLKDMGSGDQKEVPLEYLSSEIKGSFTAG
ncbi:MAG: histidine--tRNA ligase [bacterium]